MRKGKIAFIDAQPMPDLIQSGVFDLDGLHAALDAKIKAMGARRIVFDALDMVLAHSFRTPPPAAAKSIACTIGSPRVESPRSSPSSRAWTWLTETTSRMG